MLPLLLALTPALAADWNRIGGTEEGRPDQPVTVFGFVQPRVEWMRGPVVEGLESPGLSAYEGQRPAFNTTGDGATWGFAVQRARLGARGSIPKTDQRVSYVVLLEAGEAPITRSAPVAFTDLSVTLSYVPGARVRVGQMKLPVMEEIVHPVPVALEFVNFSTTLVKLLGENPIVDGAFDGGFYAFRDVGVQVFDGFQHQHLAGAYAVMVSNGRGPHAADDDNAKDVSGRIELAWVTDGELSSPKREDVKLGGWWLEGRRDVDGSSVRRVRRGAYVRVEQGVAWGMVELAQGEGALQIGAPFRGADLQVVPDGAGWGVVGQGGVRVPLAESGPRLGLAVRYDQYHQQTETDAALRVFRTGTLGVEVDPVPAVRLQANYELRRLAAPQGSADARTLAASMGDRVSFQVTARF